MALVRQVTGIFLTLFMVADFGCSLSSWDQEAVTVNQGDNLELTCTATNMLQPLNVVRIIKATDTEPIPITDGSDIKDIFLNTKRYAVNYKRTKNQQGVLRLTFTGIRGEDAGRIGCHLLEGDQNVSYVQVTVQVPIQSLSVVALGPGATALSTEDMGSIQLVEGESRGVACVASVDGSLDPPGLTITMDGQDSTRDFVATQEPKVTDHPNGELATHTVQVTLSYTSQLPSPQFNQRNMTCTATQPGFPQQVASAWIYVKFAPIITCPKFEHYGQVGKSVTITCTVKSNPGGSVTWSYGKEATKVTEIRNPNKDSHLVLEEQSLNEDEVEVSLTISSLAPEHFTKYYLSADNDIGESEITTLMLNQGSAPGPSGNHANTANQGGYQVSANTPNTGGLAGAASVTRVYSVALLSLAMFLSTLTAL